jgi:hypothetical protein
MAWVFDHASTDDPTDQLVLLAIADRCDDEGLSAYPSIGTLARKTRLVGRTVTRVIKRLRIRGVLRVDLGKGRRGTNVYSVIMTPGQKVTPDGESPLTPDHGTPDGESFPTCPRVTPTPDGESPDPSGTSSTSLTSEEVPVAAPRPEVLQTLWNELTTPPIPRCVELSLTRRKAAAGRLQERGIEGMREVFTKVNASSFLRGDNDRGWRATFDWALKPANITKVLEGNYGRTAGAKRPTGRTGPPDSDKYGGLEQRDELVAGRAS